jgi:hypothetical protein
VVPDRRSVVGAPSTSGSKLVAVPVVVSNAASRLRVVPPLTVVKEPPA